ncbi:MAG: tetratricopeptide repeat protein [Candidatus Sabulitectum sp.]|nr:tetratricopeptide repeat protein [Candidatus Sabulitectum sp.]
MLNVIPRFIQDQIANRVRRGEIDAATVFIDISGFTSMAERLYRYGKEGSEILSEMLNGTFQPIIKEIHSFGGFVSSFPGDAISAVFPSKSMHEIELFVRMIQNQFSEEPESTPFGKFSITARIGVSQGLVSWGVVGKARRKAFFFRGKAIVDSARATDSCLPGEVVFVDYSPMLIKSVCDDSFREYSDDISDLPDIGTKTASYFTHRKVLGIGEMNGEFREVVSIFISFREMDDSRELNEFASMLLNATAGFGGYFNGLFFDDKGATALVLFGAPVAYENNVERALEFILSVREDTRWDIRAGMTKGIAYTGVLGSKPRCTYTAIGDVVNTAARIMGKAQWNQILLSSGALKNLEIEYQTVSLKPLVLKGKKQAVEVFELAGGRRGVSRNFISDKFVGRHNELKSAADFIVSSQEEERTGGILYAYGDLGTGKSRYLFELSEQLSNSFRTITLKTDDVLRKSLNPFTSFLRKFFNQGDSQTKTDNKIVFEEIWEELIEDLLEIEDTTVSDAAVDSLENLHSVIGAMLGFSWGGSFYETLDAVGRFENTLYALNELFCALSLLHPTIIIIEDLQWLDSDSSKAFEILLRSLKDYPLIIMASSRFNDDGSKSVLDVEGDIPRLEITLDALSDEYSLELITNLIEHPSEKELSSFIISRTKGNPFYLEQFCLYLLENGHIYFASGVGSLIRKEHEIPAGIKTVIIARLDRLPEALREMVQSASILGQEFDSKVLAAMHNSKDTLALLKAGERELIWTSSPVDSLYSFRHPLLRDASYDMQLRGDLRKLHRKAAEAVLRLFPEDRDQYNSLAYHYEKANMLRDAIHYYELAADHSRINYRNYEAIEMYDKLNQFYFWTEKVLMTSGTAIFESISAPGFKDFNVLVSILKYIMILSNQALVQQVSGKWDRAEKTCRTILKLAERIGDRQQIAEAQYRLGSHLSQKGVYDKAQVLLLSSLKEFREISNIESTSKVLGSIGVIHWRKGNCDEATKYYEKQLEISSRASDLEELSHAFVNMGIVEFTRGDFHKAMEYFKKHLALAIKLGDRRGEAKAFGNLGIAYSSQKNPKMAMECLNKELVIEKELGHKAGISATLGNMGTVYVRQSNYAKAMICYRKHLKVVRELGDRSGTAIALWNIGLLFIKQGEYENALYFYLESLTISEELVYQSSLISDIVKLGNLYKLLERYHEAEKTYLKAFHLIDKTEQKKELCKCQLERVDLYYCQKKYSDADALNKEVSQLTDKSGNEELVFRSNLLKELILSKTELDRAVSNLEEMLACCSVDEQKAELHFELHNILRDNEHREKALEMYRLLYDSEPLYSFLAKINQLKES